MLYAEASTGAVRIAWASCTAIVYGCSNASLKLLNFRWESHTAAALINILGEIARRLGGSRCTRICCCSRCLRIVSVPMGNPTPQLRKFNSLAKPHAGWVDACATAWPRDLFLLLFMIYWSCQRLGAATWSASSPKCCALTLEPCRLPRTSRPWPCREARSDA